MLFQEYRGCRNLLRVGWKRGTLKVCFSFVWWNAARYRLNIFKRKHSNSKCSFLQESWALSFDKKLPLIEYSKCRSSKRLFIYLFLFNHYVVKQFWCAILDKQQKHTNRVLNCDIWNVCAIKWSAVLDILFITISSC